MAGSSNPVVTSSPPPATSLLLGTAVDLRRVPTALLKDIDDLHNRGVLFTQDSVLYVQRGGVLAASRQPRGRRFGLALRRVLAHVRPQLAASLCLSAGSDDSSLLQAFYKLAQPPASAPPSRQHPDIHLAMRPYQLQSSAWMVQRETSVSAAGSHPAWFELEPGLFMHRLTGLCTDAPVAAPPEVRGGILAEEMGLGKTIEVLQVVLSNPPPPGSIAPPPALPLRPAPAGRVEAECLVCNLSSKRYKGAWVCCRGCMTWHHLDCVNFRGGKSKRRALGSETDSQPAAASSAAAAAAATPTPHFLCIPCKRSLPVLASKTTLVVTPDAIADQWLEEIEHHVRHGALRATRYMGVSRGSQETALSLLEYDVVVTTYAVLRSELDFVRASLGSERRSRRHRKRFEVPPSPLTSVHFWRLILDEAQMVESTTSKAAAMGSMLSAQHRWAVTGTPVQKDVGDLHGLFRFLHAEPWANKRWWRVCARYESELARAVRGRVWRHSKASVADQLHIPPQHELVASVKLSPVERYFYQKQARTCQERVWSILNRLRDPTLSAAERMAQPLDARSVSQLIEVLLVLRQVCCHPQVGAARGGAARGLNNNPAQVIAHRPMTMDELLKQLTDSARQDCEEDLRLLVSASNGLAALALIGENLQTALELYQSVLEQPERYRVLSLRVDRFQQIHALMNMGEVLAKLGRAQEAKAALQRATELKQGYASQVHGQLLVRHAEAKAAEQKSAAELEAGRRTWAGQVPWWSIVLEAIGRDEHLARQFMDRVWQTLVQLRRHAGDREDSLLAAVRDISGVAYYLGSAHGKLVDSREAIVTRLGELMDPNVPPSREQVRESGACQACRPEQTGDVCAHCRARSLLDVYQSRLFSFVGERGEEAVEHRQLSQQMSEAEAVLRVAAAFVKRVKAGLPPDLAQRLDEQHAQHHIKTFAVLKSEFTALTELWKAQYDYLSALDELDMAAMRIRLALPDEVVAEHAQRFVLQPPQVPVLENDFKQEKQASAAALRDHLGQLHFLRNLARVGGGAGEQQRECPVCRELAADEVVFFPCGHFVCTQCIVHMLSHARRVQRNPNPSVGCATCRKRAGAMDLRHVSSWAVSDVSGIGGEEEGEEEVAVEKPQRPSNWRKLEADESDEDVEMAEAMSSNGHGGASSSAAAAAAAADSEDRFSQFERQVGSPESGPEYSSKIMAVVRRLQTIRVLHPGAKSIVFSQWVDVLKILGRAMTDCGLEFALATSSKLAQALTKFRTSKTCDTLLLPVRRGAKGLNLTQATHVLMFEPVLNPSQYLQAIGRVHRIGQTQDTYVHSFVVANSIEERIRTVCQRKIEQFRGTAKLAERDAIQTPRDVLGLIQ